MRLERGWAVVWVHNLSRQGMMLWSSRPPRPGAYIELRRATTTIIARAVWVRDKFFGIKTEEPLDFRRLLNGIARPVAPPPLPPKLPDQTATAIGGTPHPRRRPPRAATLDFGLVAVAVAVAAGVTALMIHRALETMAYLIGNHLAGGG